MFYLAKIEPLKEEVHYKLDGEVRITQKIKYEFETDDPFDPKRKIRDGKYYEDRISCSLLLTVNDYYDLLTFLQDAQTAQGASGLWLIFKAEGDETKAYPITETEELPEMKDARGDYFKATIKLKSVHRNPLTHKPVFLNYGAGNYGDGGYGY